MENIKVCVVGYNHMAVKTDTKRFGKQAILYEGHTFIECFNWIKDVTGRTEYGIVGRTYSRFRDSNGDTLPTEMDVLITPKS